MRRITLILGRSYGCALFPVLLALFPTAGAARAQTVAYDSETRHSFAVPHASVPAGQALPGGWTDRKGGIYSVAGGSLKAVSTDTTGYLRNLALRPPSESAADMQGMISVPNGLPSSATANGLVLRFQPKGTFYLFQISRDTLYAYKIVEGTTVISLKSIAVDPVPANPYSLTATAVNALGGVTLSVSARDTRTGKPIGRLSVTDLSAPITHAGRVGVDSWVGSNAAGPMTALYSRTVFSRLPAVPGLVSHASPKIGFIGDSITSGYNQVGSTITPGTNDVAALTVQKLSEAKATALADDATPWGLYNQGSSGSSTADWQPGGPDSLNTRAKHAFLTAFGPPDPKKNPVWVLVMLGTNDVRSDHLFTADQHKKNLQAITDDLVASGFNVILNHAPSFVAPTSFNGVTWNAASLALLRSYLPAEQSVAASFAGRAPGRVFVGDTLSFDEFAARPVLFQEFGVYGGLHPNGTGGTDTLASEWARVFTVILQGTRPAALKSVR